MNEIVKIDSPSIVKLQFSTLDKVKLKIRRPEMPFNDNFSIKVYRNLIKNSLIKTYGSSEEDDIVVDIDDYKQIEFDCEDFGVGNVCFVLDGYGFGNRQLIYKIKIKNTL
ncbi:hypothetical protein [Aquimarina sp. 2201CG14-23]|uniref:hypothetical protein n=1 Tax=Aquimarina mycalae TaxID=3040073 RepID=UPI0024781751|nr:hypothetical protein [Aquimarina sp. 2201CG14-23]MDH7444685.1 hypothetical protein [Aquimarina sp. 2201CG14-23]